MCIRDSPQGALARAHARLGHLAAHPADLARRPADQPGLALPGTPPARAARVDRIQLGDVGEQPPREVLPTHVARKEAAGRGACELAALHAGCRARAPNDLSEAPNGCAT